MYNDKGQFEPTDGKDYKMMLETMLDKRVEAETRILKDLEWEAEKAEIKSDLFFDEFDVIVTGGNI